MKTTYQSESYKIVTSKALGTMHAQHSLIAAGTLTWEQSIYDNIVILISGALMRADYYYESVYT